MTAVYDPEHQHRVLERELGIKDKRSTKTSAINVGDNVVIRAGIMLSNGLVYDQRGVVERIDGGYYYVRPLYYQHQIELYNNEIIKENNV